MSEQRLDQVETMTHEPAEYLCFRGSRATSERRGMRPNLKCGMVFAA